MVSTPYTTTTTGEPIITAIVPTHLPLLAHRNTLFLITPTYPGRAPRRSFLRRHIASLRVWGKWGGGMVVGCLRICGGDNRGGGLH